MAHSLSSVSPLAGSRSAKPQLLPCRSRGLVVASAEPREVDGPFNRRSMGALLGAVLVATTNKPADAAYGEAARVFGSKPTNSSGFIPYKGSGFSLMLPARWTQTLERDDKDVQLRYEDTYPANNMIVYATKTSKNSIADFGSPESFLKQVSFLFGDNSWHGTTRSEGGFKADAVSSASILDLSQVTGKDGKPHINAHVLTRSADGNEGGKHQIISAAVSQGQLFIMKAQIGDKRWNKGGGRDSKMLQDSFAVA